MSKTIRALEIIHTAIGSVNTAVDALQRAVNSLIDGAQGWVAKRLNKLLDAAYEAKQEAAREHRLIVNRVHDALQKQIDAEYVRHNALITELYAKIDVAVGSATVDRVGREAHAMTKEAFGFLARKR